MTWRVTFRRRREQWPVYRYFVEQAQADQFVRDLRQSDRIVSIRVEKLR